MSIAEAYAQNFWQMGNIITGFAVTEALLVILYIGSVNPRFERNVSRHRGLAATLKVSPII
jgi:hypothetical protein